MTGYGLPATASTVTPISPDFRIKRTGQNVMDLFDNNDEQNFATNSPQEVWYADFDGGGQDTFCT